jgi:hypothetical protein
MHDELYVHGVTDPPMVLMAWINSFVIWEALPMIVRGTKLREPGFRRET